jgi:hypothetical protein
MRGKIGWDLPVGEPTEPSVSGHLFKLLRQTAIGDEDPPDLENAEKTSATP